MNFGCTLDEQGGLSECVFHPSMTAIAKIAIHHRCGVSYIIPENLEGGACRHTVNPRLVRVLAFPNAQLALTKNQ